MCFEYFFGQCMFQFQSHLHLSGMQVSSSLLSAQIFTRCEMVLHVKCPFTLAHDRFAGTIFPAAIDVHLRRADHEVHVV